MRTVLGPQKTTVAHISMLQELLTAAKAESANEELVLQASKLIARLRSESEVQQRISATAVLCEVDCFKEADGREEMPDWSRDTERFEEFHEDFKRVMEDAERDQISEILMNTALEQLDKIERLLVDKKQTEEEMRLKERAPSSDAFSDFLTGLPAAMKKLLMTVVAALTPEASSAFIRQVALSEASGNRGLQPLDDDEREARDAEIEAERTVKEAEAALQERDEKPRHGKGQPLFATIAALRTEKGLPYTEFEPRCIKHMEEVSSSLADAYGDVQVKHLLTQECRLEAEFPRTVDTGFDDVKECLKFADEFKTAKREDKSFKQFCKRFFEASDLPADWQAIPKQTETAAKKTARSSWWDKAYRAPNVMRQSTQDSSEVIESAGTSKARARRGSTDKTTEIAGKPKTAQAEEGTESSRPEVGKSTEAEGAGEDSAEDTGEAAYEEALRSGKSPEEAARVAAEAASKVAEDGARKSGKSPEEVQRAAAAAAYKAGVSNGMSKKEAEDASSEAAEDVSAKAARGIPGSSRGSDSGEGSAASTDTPAAASAESQRDAASGAVAPERGWFQWLWNLLWPVQTPWPEKPFNNTLGPAKNKTTEIGLQQSDLERLDAILRQERPDNADGIVANTDQKEYTSACVVHLKKVGTAIDSSYSDQQAQEVLESQCLLEKDATTSNGL
ncbi:Kidins220 [Symbiodinium necroappetens]|uniref:Kidins220 protein n=1 Tax=Symbiodinium necroappetens TaxID=1628268 RepID=A0A812ZT25_9DINO|nr:Kidins220 [Symbiodinium necroappetens]